MEVVKTVPGNVTCKYCPTTFTDPMGMVQLMYHVSVHLNHNPEIHRASPWSSWHLQTPRN